MEDREPVGAGAGAVYLVFWVQHVVALFLLKTADDDAPTQAQGRRVHCYLRWRLPHRSHCNFNLIFTKLVVNSFIQAVVLALSALLHNCINQYVAGDFNFRPILVRINDGAIYASTCYS